MLARIWCFSTKDVGFLPQVRRACFQLASMLYYGVGRFVLPSTVDY
jgi:hypothetical protein